MQQFWWSSLLLRLDCRPWQGNCKWFAMSTGSKGTNLSIGWHPTTLDSIRDQLNQDPVHPVRIAASAMGLQARWYAATMVMWIFQQQSNNCSNQKPRIVQAVWAPKSSLPPELWVLGKQASPTREIALSTQSISQTRSKLTHPGTTRMIFLVNQLFVRMIGGTVTGHRCKIVLTAFVAAFDRSHDYIWLRMVDKACRSQDTGLLPFAAYMFGNGCRFFRQF